MKKSLIAIIAAALAVLLAGCGGTNAKNNPNSVSSVIEKQMAAATAAATAAPSATAAAAAVSGKVDVDLTKLSSTMVYSEVYNMMYEPQNYIGKTVRMKGQFALYPACDENGNVLDVYYFACVIADATACCQQGLEFVLTSDKVFPDDYPFPGDEITVTGEFSTYYEGGYMYCTLINAVLG